MNENCNQLNYYGYDVNGSYIKKRIPEINQTTGYSIYNMHGELSPGFSKIENSPEYNGKTVYTSMDARLYDAARNDRMGLDKPPLDGNIDMEKIYNNPTLNDYKCKSYNRYDNNGYKDIKAGQIIYYTRDGNTPFNRPVFVENSTMHGIKYKNPMDNGIGSIIYTKKPVEYNNPMNTLKKEYDGGLSWIRDSSSFREDLIARQKIKMNSRVWF
jgi:hypothetical protein